jgi:hypothetical protein
MARETKEERKAREAAEREAQMRTAFETVSAGWAVRFANVMVEFANLPGFSVSKGAVGVYKFAPPEDLMGWNHDYEVPAVLVFEKFYDGLNEMENAEHAVERYYEAVAEAERKYKVYQGALAKLNPEEQEMLKSNWGVHDSRY